MCLDKFVFKQPSLMINHIRIVKQFFKGENHIPCNKKNTDPKKKLPLETIAC